MLVVRLKTTLVKLVALVFSVVRFEMVGEFITMFVSCSVVNVVITMTTMYLPILNRIIRKKISMR